jgi:ketosteroid isomerase-like protein
MKRLSVIFLLLAAVLGTKAQSKDETDVAAGVEKLRAAMVSGNKADLESVLSDDLNYSHSGGQVQTKAIFVESITTKASDFKTIELTGQTISVIGDVAVVKHTLIADTNDGGKPAHIQLGIVLVWKKAKGQWKLIARRAFHVPVEK